MQYPIELDELHSVSDLHQGGLPGFQIFDQGDKLARFFDHLAAKPPGVRVGLLLNGDLVDFLAEKPSMYFDPHGAIPKMERIFEDPAFKPVFQGLARYVRTPGRLLILTLGNHDLELTLPDVKARLLEELAGDDLEARARIHLCLDGTGFVCKVGKAKVLATHGNEVDTWNVNDYEALRRVARDLQMGRELEDWRACAGAHMVIDVMNDVKKKIPLVDLLKPEDKAVFPVLFAVDPSQASKMRRLAPIVARLAGDEVRRRTGFLSADEESAAATRDGAPMDEDLAFERMMGGVAGGAAMSGGESVDDLLDFADDQVAVGPASLSVQGSGDKLGAGGLLFDLILRRPPEENLREALQKWLANDPSFDVLDEDSFFKLIDDLVGPDFDFVLTGHTHRARALRRKKGRGYYFNSGTWVRLIELTPEMLEKDRFDKVFKAFRAGSMKELDATEGLVLRKSTVVSIWKDDDKVHGELRRAEMDGDKLVLKPVDGTRFTTGH